MILTLLESSIIDSPQASLANDDRGRHVNACVLWAGVASSGAGVSIRADASDRSATCYEAAGGRRRLHGPPEA